MGTPGLTISGNQLSSDWTHSVSELTLGITFVDFTHAIRVQTPCREPSMEGSENILAIKFDWVDSTSSIHGVCIHQNARVEDIPGN